MLFIFGCAIYGDFPLLIIFLLIAFFTNLGIEIIKDIDNISRDIDRKTSPERIGKRKTISVQDKNNGKAEENKL